MTRIQHFLLLCTVLGLIAIVPSSASAQTGAELLIRPFPKGIDLETETDATFLERADIDASSIVGGGEEDLQLSIYQSSGRVREVRENFIPRVGYDLSYLDLGDGDRLVDVSVGAGFALPDVYGFTGGLAVGVGYAGDTPFADANAWYYKATAVFGKKLDPRSDLVFVVDYDGNRSVLPDVPLPGFAYRRQVDTRLTLVAGVPISSLEWRPNEKLTLELVYTLIDQLDARADYALVEQWHVFARFEQRRWSFNLDELPDDRRLLFAQRRAEAGVHWEPREDVSLTLAGGYAFGQEFSTGWDYRDTDEVADLDDAPFVRVGFEARF